MPIDVGARTHGPGRVSERQDYEARLIFPRALEGLKTMNQIRKEFENTVFITSKSSLGFVETIQKIKRNGMDRGWYNPTIYSYMEVEKDFGLQTPHKVATISLRLPRLEHGLLKYNKNFALVLPLKIGVFEADEQVYVAWFDVTALGRLIGNRALPVFEEVVPIMMDALKGIITEKESIKWE